VTHEVLVAGFGGQGVMLLGRLLAYGAIYEGLQVTFYPSYGPEMRGGTANCTVVVSTERIGSPVRNRFTHLLAMNQASVDKFVERVKPGGTVVYNASMVESPPSRPELIWAGVAANRIAAELTAPQAANMVALGALAARMEGIGAPALYRGLERVLPRYRHDAIPLNREAIRVGIEAAGGEQP
jgi:2-oxoglutarate ferredoxin oxidoreductase subunit gamma